MSQKLKGIYDALDYANYKNALKLCAALLKKEPNNALCKALNAITLEKLGRREEALTMCDEARAGVGVDDTVLNTVQIVYKRCRQYAKITAMYDAAWTKDPDNKDYGIALFTSAIRERDFAKSQQVATKLYKKLSLPKYLHWVVVSLLLQAREKKDAKALDLAEMMLRKAPVEPPVKSSDDDTESLNRGQQHLLLLHLTTLRSKGKCAEALELLEPCKDHMPFPADAQRLRVRLLEEGGRISDAAKAARALILLDTSSWASVQDYIRLAFSCPFSDSASIQDHGLRLHGPFGKRTEKTAAASLEDFEKQLSEDEVWNAVLFVEYLNQLVPSGHKSRVPELARLELYRSAFRSNEAATSAKLAESGAEPPSSWRSVVSTSDWEEYVRLITSYLQDHGGRNDVFFDLKPFLCLLEASDALPLFDVLKERCEADSQKTTRAAGLGLARLRRGFARPVPEGMEASITEVSKLLSEWAATSTDNEKGPEEYLVLAVMSLVDIDRAHCHKLNNLTQMADRPYLLDALALAETGLKTFPQCYAFKVVSMLLCASLGLPSAMLKWYATLELKNIQYESLMYLAFDCVSMAGCHEASGELGRTIKQFHDDFDKDTSEALNTAFHMGVYQRIPEYVEGFEVMGHSILWGRAVVEDALSAMTQAQTFESLMESLAFPDGLLLSIARKPADWWVFRNQDRSMLQGWQPLPSCSPLGAEALHSSGSSWRGGGPVPTVLVQSGRCHSNTSAAEIWEPSAEVSQPTPLPPSRCGSEACIAGGRSAVDELVVLGLECSGSRLRMMSSAVVAVHALYKKDEAMVAEALEAARATLVADDIPLANFEELVVEGSSEAAFDVGNFVSDMPKPWCIVAPAFRALVRQGAVAGAELAQLALLALSSAEGWESLDRGLAAVTCMVRKCVSAVRQVPKCDEVAATSRGFSLSRHGPAMLWLFLNEFAAIVIPVALWCTATMPKGGGKKAKDGQEALHAARVSIKSLLDALKSGLTDFQGDLGSAEKAVSDAPKTPETQLKCLADLPEFLEIREKVPDFLQTAHQQHLGRLQEALTLRLALLKTKSSFKP